VAFRTVSGPNFQRESKSEVAVFYLHVPIEDAKIEDILRGLEYCKVSTLVFFVPHHSSDLAFRVGKLVGRSKFQQAEWAFSMQHLRQLLRAKNVAVHRNHEATAAEGGTSQIKRKMRDLTELTMLMDEYVSAPREQEWLSTPLSALQNKTPRDLIGRGRVRDVVVEFLRMREGQPV
jgi:hypothetical protein